MEFCEALLRRISPLVKSDDEGGTRSYYLRKADFAFVCYGRLSQRNDRYQLPLGSASYAFTTRHNVEYVQRVSPNQSSSSAL